MSYELEFNDQPICPHCGYAETDAWEYDFGKNECIEGER